ncbi:MAG TPA: hypothetical protein VHH34_09645 [Pseudonocardiaceae bacterium]|nr:hypothetical protein [Pseudonocardiaceae bacterium]
MSVVLRWLEQPGTRLVGAEHPWSEPAAGAGRWRTWLRLAEAARAGYTGAD